MLLKQETVIKLEKTFLRITCVSTAYNNTFVAVRVDKPAKQESIVHFNAQGKILYQHTYEDVIDTFGQMNEKEVIVLNVLASKIDIINLETKTVKFVNHQYLFQDAVQMLIYNFAESRTFCVQEKGLFNDHRLRLSYYSYDGLGENSEPVAEYTSKENQWTYDHLLYKGNAHSKVIWFLPRNCQEITFTYFDLQTDPAGKLDTVRAVNTLGSQYGTDNPQLNVAGIWEVNPNQYLVYATSNKCDLKQRNQFGVFNNNYILDTTLGNQQGKIRQTKFCFEAVSEDFSYNDQLIYSFGVGNFSVFHTFRHEKGEPLETPVYYINNLTEERIAIESWASHVHLARFYFPGWDPNIFIQAKHENGDIQEITVWTKKVLDIREISLHFLLSINQDFDDDLLQDALDLLHS